MSVSADIALPGSTVQYWKLSTEANHYWRIGGGFVLYLDGQVGYGKTYGGNGISDTQFDALRAATMAADPSRVVTDMRQDFPFWQNYYSGGVRDVRGFQDNTLGPRVCTFRNAVQLPNGACSDGGFAQPIGGAFKVLGTAQVFLPLPFLKDVNTARLAWFVDTGNAYKDYKSFDASTLRASTGLSLQWQAPIGPLIISLAFPFRSQPQDSRYEERIQFTFGSQF
jgi:outer membrane protein insertion porin family